MRILITIPHYYKVGPMGGLPGIPHGSLTSRRDQRLATVLRCLSALHETFGARQRLGSGPNQAHWPQGNAAITGSIDVVLCTSGADHLAADIPQHLFAHGNSSVDPRLLGFMCHRVLRDNIGRYDLYGYLEDDIELADPLFFAKLRWFGAQFGPGTLLQPNRFEADPMLETMKLYVDGTLSDPRMQAPHQDITINPKLSASALGIEWRFQRVDNVHAGCFFLSAEQLATVVDAPEFGTPSAAFVGPLESAATLMIMRNFDVYKPARENAAFLEVRHLDNRMLIASPAPQPERQVAP